MAPSRRDLILGAASLGLAGAAPGFANPAGAPAPARDKAMTDAQGVAVYVPGYMPEAASYRGRPVARDPVFARAIRDPKSPFRMLTRIGLDGDIRQALLPAFAHDVEIAPGGKVGVLCGFEARDHVAFDPQSLDLFAAAPSGPEGWRGGGHAAYLADGSAVLLSERAPRAWRASLESHYGRITIRDPLTLKVRETYSSHGVDPHDMTLIDDGRILAVANYGSTPKKGARDLSIPRDVREACVTLVEVASGKLVDKRVVDTRDTELRHIAARDIDRIFGIQAKLGPEDEAERLPAPHRVAEGVDITGESGLTYLAAPTLLLGRSRSPAPLGDSGAQALMRHGLSIIHDPAADEIIATFPATHSVIVFDAVSGAVLHQLDTSRMGLRFPCGATLLPGGTHYAVTGYWENLFVFERRTHRLVRDLCLYPVFFGHSHITAA